MPRFPIKRSKRFQKYLQDHYDTAYGKGTVVGDRVLGMPKTEDVLEAEGRVWEAIYLGLSMDLDAELGKLGNAISNALESAVEAYMDLTGDDSILNDPDLDAKLTAWWMEQEPAE